MKIIRYNSKEYPLVSESSDSYLIKYKKEGEGHNGGSFKAEEDIRKLGLLLDFTYWWIPKVLCVVKTTDKLKLEEL